MCLMFDLCVLYQLNLVLQEYVRVLGYSVIYFGIPRPVYHKCSRTMVLVLGYLLPPFDYYWVGVSVGGVYDPGIRVKICHLNPPIER